MQLKSLLLWSAIILLQQTVRAQALPIDSIATQYRNWLTGEGVDYSRTEINQRYTRFLSSGSAARNLSAYNFANPGPVWNFNNTADQSDYSTFVEQKLIRLVFLYQTKGPVSNPNPAYHAPALGDTLLMLFNYMKEKGISGSTDFAYLVIPSTEEVITSGHGVALRSSAYATAVLLMKDELIAAGEFNHHMAALQSLTDFMDPDFPYFNFTYPGYNTDVIRASIQQRFCYVLAQDDTSSTRVTDMAYLKDFINNALLIGYGWSDCIKPDFVTYHHRGVYANSYGADALHQAAILNRILKGTAYELSATAQSNLKNAVLTYRKFDIDFTMPRGLAGRFPGNTGYLDNLRPALAYLYITDTVANADAAQEFKRLWNISATANLSLQRANTLSINMINSLGGMTDMLQVLDAALTPAPELTEGQFSFPYAGLSVHKYNGYQASVKGTSKHIWHYENSATENLFGQYTSAGALELLTTGNPVTPDSNGLTFNGWDWAHIPGTTVANVPYAVMVNSIMRQMDGKNFLAHASLDSNGVFAMDYKDINSATGMTALKTVFFFKDKILCLGSNIKDSNGTYPIHTTLFQTAFTTGNTSLVNGTSVSGNNYTFSQTGGPFWASDALGNGFVLPASPYNTQAVTVQRSSQTSPNQANTANTTGDFAKAYLNHGIAPAAASYQYAVILQGAAAGTQALANNFSAYFNVLKQDSQAHVVQYVPDSIYSYVVFDTNTVLSNDLLQRVNKPSVVMTQQRNGGNQVKVSLTNPNLGLLAPGEAYTWSQISGTASRLYRIPQTDVVKITLQGTWQVDAGTPNPNVSVSINNTNTDVSFSTKNGITEQVTLVRTVPLPLGLASFQTRPEGCATLLTWKQESDNRNIKNVAVERSTDGRHWVQLALLPPGACQYRDEAAGSAFYRLGIWQGNNVCTYSAVLQNIPGDCPPQPVKVYPNPAQDIVYVVADRKLSGNDIRLTDGRGAGVAVPINCSGNRTSIDLRPLPAGIYFMEVMGAVHKIVKR